MTEIAFYHLERAQLELALSKLLEKTLAAGKRALVIAGTEARVESLANALWTYDQDSWLPHGTTKDGNAKDQPVWLTTDDANPNNATFLFLADGVTTDRLDDYERCFEMFDGNDPAMVEVARGHHAGGQFLGLALELPAEVLLGVERRARDGGVDVDVREGLAEVDLVVRDVEVLEGLERLVAARGDDGAHVAAVLLHAPARGEDDVVVRVKV